jgi:hypothetical protein
MRSDRLRLHAANAHCDDSNYRAKSLGVYARVGRRNSLESCKIENCRPCALARSAEKQLSSATTSS